MKNAGMWWRLRPALVPVRPLGPTEAKAEARATHDGSARLRKVWHVLRGQRWLQPKQRRLRVSETVALGEKRFVAIVEVDGSSFLIGGGTATVSLLKELGKDPVAEAFQGALQDAWQGRESA